MSIASTRAIWGKAGTAVFLYALGTFFASRNPRLACPFDVCILGGNADSTRYWGVLGSLMGIAVVAWASSIHVRLSAGQSPWWKRLPPLPEFESPTERSRLLTIAGLIAYVGVPWLSATAMSAVLWHAPIVRHDDGAPLSGTPLDARLASITDACAWTDYCFQLGDRTGIEYKPILTDAVIVLFLILAVAVSIRLVLALISTERKRPVARPRARARR